MTGYEKGESSKAGEYSRNESNKITEFNKNPIPNAKLFWRRLATPRETMFGLRSDGTVRNICSNIEINSSMEIDKDLLEKCAEHFNRDMECFREFLTEKKESNDIWLVKTNKSSYVVQELADEIGIDVFTIEDEINAQLRTEDSPKWKLYCSYVGFDTSGGPITIKYPYIYQLVFVFSTGSLDEFSCALICDLFLNILDCALKEHPFHHYSHLNMYDIGIKVEDRISNAICELIKETHHYNLASKRYHKMNTNPCSNFDFKMKEIIDKGSQFRTLRYVFDPDCTRIFLELCEEKNVGVYAVFVVIINYALMHHAVRNGFKGIFRTRMLHMVNARYLLNQKDKKYSFKLGSHFIPYMQNFKLESTDIEEIFKEAPRVERELERITRKDLFWEHEAVREVSIKESRKKYNSGKWNPHFCFSITNLGTLDVFYEPESPKNTFRVLSYERASTPIEGGHFDVIICIFRNKLAVHVDYSNEYFSDNEMLTIMKSISYALETV